MVDVVSIISITIDKVVKDTAISIDDPTVVTGFYNDFIYRYIKQNRKIVYSDKELICLYKDAKKDFIRYMKTFYKR